MPAITLVISSHRQSGPLSRILRALAVGSVIPAQIIVAEDGSDAETAGVIAAARPALPCEILHLTQENQGFRKSRILNEAMRRASGDYLVFLDGDCVPHRDFIRDHVRLAKPGTFVQGRRAFIGIDAVPDYLSGRCSITRLIFTGRTHGTAKAFRLPFPICKQDTELHGILGCNLAIWKDDLFAINGYDESFVGWGKEDSDLAARLYHLGRRRRFVRNHAVVYHLDHPPAARTGLPSNEAKLAETLASRRIRAPKGLSHE